MGFVSKTLSYLSLAVVLCQLSPSVAFAPRLGPMQHKIAPSFFQNQEHGLHSPSNHRGQREEHQRSKTSLHMFMGSDGGLLGVGGPELATILLVGYFVLGPSDLYKLTKEIGKFITNIRTFSTDLTKTFENNMESQLQLEDLRKAQRELNDAFSFRRSINVDDSEAFATTVDSPRPAAATEEDLTEESSSTEATPTKKKKRLRRIKKKEPEELVAPVTTDQAPIIGNSMPEELTMPTASSSGDTDFSKSAPSAETDDSTKYTKEELEQINKDFDAYTMNGVDMEDNDWFNEPLTGRSTGDPFVQAIPEEGLKKTKQSTVEQSRFQQQLSGTWNEQILSNEDSLNPLASVMELLAVLEEEKIANDRRLQEEFEQRRTSQDEYYQKQRKLLQDAANKVQMNATGQNMSTSDTNNVAVTTMGSSSSDSNL